MKAFKNALIYVAGEGVKKSTVVFDEKIVSIGEDSPAEEIVLPEGAIVLPGFVDQHIHGAAPGGQIALHGPDHVGVDHVHQGREPFAEFGQHPGQGADDTGGDVAAEHLHHEGTPPCVLSVRTAVREKS